MLLTFFDMSARTHYLNARRTLRKLLDWRIVPVINENDTTTTDEISFGDNDFLAAQVAVLVGARAAAAADRHRRALHRRPADRPRRAARRRGRPTPRRSARWRSATRSSPLGSGGMRSKVVAAEMATAAGHPDRDRAAGSSPACWPRAWAGEPVGTRFAPAGRAPLELQAVAEVRQAHATGRVVRRRGRGAGAARGRHEPAAGRHRRRDAASFDAGDAVEVRAAGRRAAIGKGICNYSAAELRRVMGLKSAEVRELLPRATEEAVHRDYFVLA